MPGLYGGHAQLIKHASHDFFLGLTTSHTCKSFPINERNSHSEAIRLSFRHFASRSRSCATLFCGKEIAILTVSITYPNTWSRVCHEDTFSGDNRGGSPVRREKNGGPAGGRKWHRLLPGLTNQATT